MIETTLTFNGFNLAPWLSTLNVTHEVETAKTITTIDGEEYAATRRRAVVTFTLIPMTEAQTNAVYEALSAMEGLTVYRDPMTDTDRVVDMRVASDIGAAFAAKSCDGNRYYKGMTITLRQKVVM